MPNAPRAISGLARSLSGQVAEQAGIPQPGATPAPGGGLDIASLLALLQSGKIPPEVLIQLLSMLTGMGGQVPGAAAAGGEAPGASPIDSAFFGG